jgi:hypothetical protein
VKYELGLYIPEDDILEIVHVLTISVCAGPGAAGSEPDEEDDDVDDEPPFFSGGKGRGKGRGPSYSSYFPILFGAYPGFGGGSGGRGGSRDDGSAYNPGVATAIANSFSTGRGAVATSHATAYGGPHFIPPSYRSYRGSG